MELNAVIIWVDGLIPSSIFNDGISGTYPNPETGRVLVA